MLQGKRTRRIIAATLLTVMLTNTLAPTVTYALTSGPTAPEATSFEPVDTTDMVNLQTGDLTYNIPLMEVPGPEGGYPLTLSYHAGIQPNEDASWVGLGWTLNPGAINRSVNGYPDDWYTPQQSRRDYWSGGQIKSYEVGVSIGIANSPATVGFGLSFSQDTYRGFGVGTYVGVGSGIKLSDNVGLNASVRVGISGYGDPYASGGIGIGVGGKDGGLNASLGASFSTNFKAASAGFSGGVGFSQHSAGHQQSFGGSLLGASISTGGNKPSFEVGGMTASVSNSNAGNIQTSSKSFGVDIPVWYGVNLSLGYSKTRYWSDETVSVTTHGSIYGSGWGVSDDVAYDTYALLEEPGEKNIAEYPDPSVVQGGAYPDFDVYSVNAQGLGGNMRPYLFQGGVLRQNIKTGGTPKVTYFSPGVTNGRPQFRFQNDFSNSYRQSYDPYGNPNLNLRSVAPPFDGTPEYGNNDGTYGTGYNDGFALAGSKYVDLNLRVKPFNAQGYNKNDRLFDGHMIEGYSIVNETGVAYHFGLPAYSWDEESYQEKIDRSGGLSFNRLKRSLPYAYTWYLTTITGPDYVDRNGNQMADDGDWGYWINFEYGKWSNNYIWRNPSEGYQRDEDNQFQNCAVGRKEVYYLNAIRTRTHVALFEKDIRLDGKAAANSVYVKNYNGSTELDYSIAGAFNSGSSQSLRLNTIYLLNKADAGVVTPASGYSEAFRPYRPVTCSDCELAANVLDITDVNAVGRSVLESKAIRVIDFKYDYSLSKGTANSFDIFGDHNAKSGKLTLNAVVNRGKGGAFVLPPMKFDYDIPVEDKKSATGTLNSTSFSTTAAVFQKGDLLVTDDAQGIFCGVITEVIPNGGTTTYQLVNSSYTASTSGIAVKTTKNPPYNKDSYDMWGMYKSDYNLNAIANNENLGRHTTPTSARSVDAWSLRQITTALGSKVKLNYEPDIYLKSVLNKEYALVMKDINIQSDRKTLQFTVDAFGFDVDDVLTSQTKYKILLLADYKAWGYNASGPPFFLGIERRTLDESYVGEFTISSINGTTVTGVLDNAVPDEYPAADLTKEYFNNVISTGNLSTNINSNFYGGGLRVASVSQSAGFSNTTATTHYDYNINNASSGITTYLPSQLDAIDVTAALDNSTNEFHHAEANLKAYKAKLYRNVNALYSIAREVPPPAVMYEYVTVSSDVKNADETDPRPIETTTQYHMEVFRENMVGRTPVNAMQQGSNSQGNYYARNWVIRKFTTSIGNVKSIVQYDKNGRKLSETINHYLHDGLENLALENFMSDYKYRLEHQFNYQGFLQERYSEVKEVTNQPNSADNGVKATLSAREEYPCINIGQTVINYVNGTQTSSTNLAYDYYSGALTKSVETDAYGNRFMTETKPAYRVAQYKDAMGLKLAGGRNMLTQTAGTYVWKVDDNNNAIGLVSASASTWGNGTSVMDENGNTFVQTINDNTTGHVWRMQSAYSWQPNTKTSDGLTTNAGFVDLNWASPATSNAGWVKTSEITLYDVYSKALEAKNINDNFSATHMGYNNARVVVSGGPAKFYEIAYSGAEDETVNGTNNVFIKKADGIVSTGTAVAHTGSKSLKIGVSGKKGFVYTVSTNNLVAGRNYLASVWVKPVSGPASDVKLYYDINGTLKTPSVTNSKVSGDWKLLNMVINGSDITAGNTLTVGCRNDHASVEAYIDDMRFQPVDATTTAYVYDQFSGELTHTLDNNNWYTRYEYDAAGRVVKTYIEKIGIGEFKTNHYEYNFGAYTTKTNDVVSQNFTKNTCLPGQVGTTHLITVPAGTISSIVSKEDANDMATRYAQAQANSIGSCYVPTAYITLNNAAAVSGYRVIFNNNGNEIIYNFPATGTSTVTVPAGTYTIGIAPTGGGGGFHTFKYEVGPDTQTQTGSSAQFTNVTFVHGSAVTLYIQ